MKLITLVLTSLLALSGLIFTYRNKETGRLNFKAYVAIAIMTLLCILNILLEIDQSNNSKNQKAFSDSLLYRDNMRKKYGDPFPIQFEVQTTSESGNYFINGIQKLVDSIAQKKVDDTGDDEARYDEFNNETLQELAAKIDPAQFCDRYYTLAFTGPDSSKSQNPLLSFKFDIKKSSQAKYVFMNGGLGFNEEFNSGKIDPSNNNGELSDYIDLNRQRIHLTVSYNKPLDKNEIKSLPIPLITLVIGSRAHRVSIKLTQTGYNQTNERLGSRTDVEYTAVLKLPM